MEGTNRRLEGGEKGWGISSSISPLLQDKILVCLHPFLVPVLVEYPFFCGSSYSLGFCNTVSFPSPSGLTGIGISH